MTQIKAYLVGLEKIELFETPIPQPDCGQVRIRVKSVGICGSDISYYQTGSTGMGQLAYPHVLGHECAGEVVELGEQVTHLRIGDRVAVEPGVPCGVCGYCKDGRYHLCEKMSFMSSAVKGEGNEGAFAEYIVRPATLLHVLPESVSYEQGALLEPISVAIHAVEQSGIQFGQKAAILGCGPIGISLLMVLKAMGIPYVSMTDTMGSRTGFAKEVGADDAVCLGDFEQESLENSFYNQFDVVFDTTCNEDAMNGSFQWLKKGGKLVLVGVPTGMKRIDLKTCFQKEITITTSFRYSNTYPRAISITSRGLLQPEKMVSHRFALGEVKEAIALAASKDAGIMKVVLFTEKK